jgi:hypothetical protein
MDMRSYYQKLREVEQSIPTGEVVVVSHATQDGGRAGVFCEVSRATAAKLVVEGRARLASHEEASDFHARTREEYHRAEQMEAAKRVQVVISEADLKAYKTPRTGK